MILTGGGNRIGNGRVNVLEAVGIGERVPLERVGNNRLTGDCNGLSPAGSAPAWWDRGFARSREISLPYILRLLGAWYAVGLSAAPRPDGSGISFCCPQCEFGLLTVKQGAALCVECGWGAKGDAPQVARAGAAVSSAREGKKLPLGFGYSNPGIFRHLFRADTARVAAFVEAFTASDFNVTTCIPAEIGCPRCASGMLELRESTARCGECLWRADGSPAVIVEAARWTRGVRHQEGWSM